MRLRMLVAVLPHLNMYRLATLCFRRLEAIRYMAAVRFSRRLYLFCLASELNARKRE